jgi:hypothetical protein
LVISTLVKQRVVKRNDRKPAFALRAAKLFAGQQSKTPAALV